MLAYWDWHSRPLRLAGMTDETFPDEAIRVHQGSFMNASDRGLRHGPDAAAGQLALTTAMTVALEDDGVATRWLVGESVFSNTRLPARNDNRGDTT
jgi:hypothetical protein